MLTKQAALSRICLQNRIEHKVSARLTGYVFIYSFFSFLFFFFLSGQLCLKLSDLAGINEFPTEKAIIYLFFKSSAPPSGREDMSKTKTCANKCVVAYRLQLS